MYLARAVVAPTPDLSLELEDVLKEHHHLEQ